ncbi:hypothetical protein E3N88_13695 [Mikania micrantha]|uniref:Uncharacterized protein n=1 Tax=Mikania micrantha TaxID=192012 RepID=A0A5N6P2D5_9ASTR|nr:hypothetical protein E3N88_13695 [Mikania micrantha]
MDAETDEEKRSQFAQKMESWKMGLTEIADLKGKDVKDRKESWFIKEVVADIHRRLHVPLSNKLPCLIGMNYEIEFIRSWLTDESCNIAADILTVVGMGGIGKTTLAKYVFQLHSNKFNKSSFIEGIDAKCKENSNGMLDLQKQLLGDISKIHNVSVYASKINNALVRKKILLVLDDVGCLDQLDALLGNEAFHQGSKIIITTKDASLTDRCALFDLPVQPNHKKLSLNGLYRYESLKLLCIHAFKSNKPKKGYIEVSEKLVKYCQGHPLALEVLGRSLQKRDVGYWEECIKVLKKEPDSRINKALKMSFDALLSKNDKELFKHIACFFVGIDRDVTETILNSFDLNARYGITNLIERCLLSIGWNNKVEMHSLIQEMGRHLVRQESPDKPWERSRSWCHEESFKVLEQNQGTENLVGLALDMRMLEKEKLSGPLLLETNALSKMDKLRLLQLNYVKMNGSYENVSKELRYLCMHGFCFNSIPSELPISKDKKLLGSLKILDLSFCEQLHSVGGFFLLPALERLILRNCTGLIEVCESVDKCDDLVHIDLSYCHNLRKLPKYLHKLKKVQTLLLDGCNPRESLNEMGNVKAIPSDLKFTMIPLLSSLRILSIANNNLSNECFPMDLSCLAMLEELHLDNNPIVSMPSCVRTLTRLKRLYMDSCKKLISIEHPPCMLRKLSFVPPLRCNTSVKKIKFDLEMPPLMLRGIYKYRGCCEIDGMLKIQEIASVEEKVLHSLGWADLGFTRGGSIECRTKVYYEFGIFSMFYPCKEMPDWIRWRIKGSSISIIIPSSLNNLRGLNFFCIMDNNSFHNNRFIIPWITIKNVTGKHAWFYKHYNHVDGEERRLYGEERRLCYLSHWMFGPNEMKAGDHITIVLTKSSQDLITLECGIGLVYDDGSMEEEEDVLGYYKSWNHIIGGDLSHFQTKTGEYDLDNTGFWQRCIRWYGGCQGIDFIVGSNTSFCWGKAGCYLSVYVAQLWAFCWVNFDWSVDFITGQSLFTIPYAKTLFGILDCTIGWGRINSGWQVNSGTLLRGGTVRIWVMLPWDMKVHANWCKWLCDWDKQSLNGAVDMYGWPIAWSDRPDSWPERLDAWVVWPIELPVFCTWWGLICARSPCVLSKVGLIWYGRPVVYRSGLSLGWEEPHICLLLMWCRMKGASDIWVVAQYGLRSWFAWASETSSLIKLLRSTSHVHPWAWMLLV